MVSTVRRNLVNTRREQSKEFIEIKQNDVKIVTERLKIKGKKVKLSL
jgi:hypothetical protein